MSLRDHGQRLGAALVTRIKRPALAGGQVEIGDLSRGALPFLRGLGGALGIPTVDRGDGPAFITWALTERCPLRCAHCDMGVALPELNRRQRLQVAHAIADSSSWGVSLIGGEVTLIADLGDIATVLSHARKHVSIGSSGLGLSRHLDALLAAPIANLTLSCDSHDGATHDAFRGRAGLFDEVVSLCERAMLGPASKRPTVQIRATIHRGNFEQLEELLAFWQPRVDNVLLQVVQNNGIHAVRDDAVLFQPEDRPAFERAMTRLTKRYPALKGRYLGLAARYVFEPDALYSDIGFRCLLVPAASMTILPDGGVKLCYGREDSRVGQLAFTPERGRSVPVSEGTTVSEGTAVSEGAATTATTASSLRDIWRRAETEATARRMQGADYGCMCWEQACSGNLDLLPARRVADRLMRSSTGPL